MTAAQTAVVAFVGYSKPAAASFRFFASDRSTGAADSSKAGWTG